MSPTTRGAANRLMQLAALTPALAVVGGCITVNAPDKPIVINLNIAITQEVVYRLDNKAKSLIQENPGIF